MGNLFLGFVVSALGGGLGVAIVAVLGREWLAVRLKAAVERQAEIRRTLFEIKREACLDALAVVDAVLSHKRWSENSKPLSIAKQTVDIARARACHSKLALTCEDADVIELYASSLGLRTHSEPPPAIRGDTIMVLRNAMRKELGFGSKLETDPQRAWIGNLDGTG